jgi:hypothetical protein
MELSIKKLLDSNNQILISKPIASEFGLNFAVVFAVICNQYQNAYENGLIDEDGFFKVHLESLLQDTGIRNNKELLIAVESIEKVGFCDVIKALSGHKCLYLSMSEATDKNFFSYFKDKNK